MDLRDEASTCLMIDLKTCRCVVKGRQRNLSIVPSYQNRRMMETKIGDQVRDCQRSVGNERTGLSSDR